jgi:hypothetical protein
LHFNYNINEYDGYHSHFQFGFSVERQPKVLNNVSLLPLSVQFVSTDIEHLELDELLQFLDRLGTNYLINSELQHSGE